MVDDDIKKLATSREFYIGLFLAISSSCKINSSKSAGGVSFLICILFVFSFHRQQLHYKEERLDQTKSDRKAGGRWRLRLSQRWGLVARITHK